MKQITEAIKRRNTKLTPNQKFFHNFNLGKYFNLENFEVITVIDIDVYGKDIEKTIEYVEDEVNNQRYSLLNVDPLIVNTSLYNENYKVNKEEKYTIVLIDLKNTKGEQYYNMYLAISDTLVRKIKMGR